jgi:hypothetical protein
MFPGAGVEPRTRLAASVRPVASSSHRVRSPERRLKLGTTMLRSSGPPTSAEKFSVVSRRRQRILSPRSGVQVQPSHLAGSRVVGDDHVVLGVKRRLRDVPAHNRSGEWCDAEVAAAVANVCGCNGKRFERGQKVSLDHDVIAENPGPVPGIWAPVR